MRRFCGFSAEGFPIRTSPDHRLLRTYPKSIAATPRPSSPFNAKASSIHPYVLLPIKTSGYNFYLKKLISLFIYKTSVDSPKR